MLRERKQQQQQLRSPNVNPAVLTIQLLSIQLLLRALHSRHFLLPVTVKWATACLSSSYLILFDPLIRSITAPKGSQFLPVLLGSPNQISEEDCALKLSKKKKKTTAEFHGN